MRLLSARVGAACTCSRKGPWARLVRGSTKTIASFPGSPRARSVLEATESWAGPGNKATKTSSC